MNNKDLPMCAMTLIPLSFAPFTNNGLVQINTGMVYFIFRGEMEF